MGPFSKYILSSRGGLKSTAAGNKEITPRGDTMKKMILLLSVCALSACSSNSKNEESAANDTATTEAAATTTPDSEQTKTESNESSQDDSMTADSGANMEGGFPDVEGTERSGATCKNGGDERMVSVIDTREGPCGVVYTKSGDKKTVAYAKHDMGFCDKVYNNIVSNLTSGGFDCGGAAANTSSSTDEQAEEAPAEEASAE